MDEGVLRNESEILETAALEGMATASDTPDYSAPPSKKPYGDVGDVAEAHTDVPEVDVVVDIDIDVDVVFVDIDIDVDIDIETPHVDSN